MMMMFQSRLRRHDGGGTRAYLSRDAREEEDALHFGGEGHAVFRSVVRYTCVGSHAHEDQREVVGAYLVERIQST